MLAIAEAVLAVQPPGPLPRRSTEVAYGRTWRRWQEGERWPEAQPATRTYILAAVRWGALNGLRTAIGALDAALTAGDAVGAGFVAEEIQGYLHALRENVPSRRGRRVRRPGTDALRRGSVEASR